ncbi:hypothetical protein HYC85_015577 [Camellia sinensis]|uniref:Ubiquitin-like protease family profile domain-containing protein n=1 Tax=Camellia sinensis TaxID=4442 RepID=A0A7J7GXA2_CAMSI|nr:hypothetical protein HYC85_015577 [Camellia sinensis]
MEEEKTKNGPRREDEPPPVLVVTTTTTAAAAAAAAAAAPSRPPVGGDRQEQSQREGLEGKRDSETLGPPRASLKRLDDERESENLRQVEKEQSQREELERKTDGELEMAITRQKRSVETLGPRLADGGVKLRANLKRLEEERERRKVRRVEKARGSITVLIQHTFLQKVGRKHSRTVNAFEKELSYMGRCDSRKMRLNGKSSPRERRKSVLSSKQSSFQCPTSLSVDAGKHVLSDGDHNGGRSTHSAHFVEEKLSGSFSMKEKTSKVMPLNGLRPRNGQPIVLVDEEEPQFIESMEQADKTVECMKESKIYYPSSDDPESIEIHYSDMECLAPEAFLSSTIMNFYIRHLQRLTSPTDSARSGYHFFNTYFYSKLNEAVFRKSDGESSFVKFRRWWKGVNIFHKAYILLPIHENLHWSLAIICIPDKEDESGPVILHLDSLGLHFSKSIFDNIKSFLIEEWKYLNQGEAPPDLPIAYRIWENLPRRIEEKRIAVPQQRNDYDCGPFVLFFMERFIDEAPQRLKKQDLAMFGKNWFQPQEASKLRRKIRKLIVEEFLNATEDNCVLDHEPLPFVHRPDGERIELSIDC